MSLALSTVAEMIRSWLMWLKGSESSRLEVGDRYGRRIITETHSGPLEMEQSQRRRKIPRCWLWRILLASNSARRRGNHLGMGCVSKGWGWILIVPYLLHDHGQLAFLQWTWVFSSARSIEPCVPQSPFHPHAGVPHTDKVNSWVGQPWEVNKAKTQLAFLGTYSLPHEMLLLLLSSSSQSVRHRIPRLEFRKNDFEESQGETR